MHILPSGKRRYEMRRDRMCFRGFLPIGQQELTVNDEVVTTRDNVNLTVSLQVFFAIQDAEKCLQNVARRVVDDLEEHIVQLVKERSRAAIATSTNNADYDNISGRLPLPQDLPGGIDIEMQASSSSAADNAAATGAARCRDTFIHMLCEQALTQTLKDIGIKLMGISKISYRVTDRNIEVALSKVATEKAALQAMELQQQGILLQAQTTAQSLEIEAKGRQKAAQTDTLAILETANQVKSNPIAEQLLLLSHAGQVISNTNTTLFLPTDSSPMNVLSASISGMLSPKRGT